MKLTTFTCKGCQYSDSDDIALCVGKEPRNISGLVLHGRSSFDVDVIAPPSGESSIATSYGITATIGWSRTGIERNRTPFLRERQ